MKCTVLSKSKIEHHKTSNSVRTRLLGRQPLLANKVDCKLRLTPRKSVSLVSCTHHWGL